MSHYGSVEYWNERYAKSDSDFEWYGSYSSIKEHIAKYIKKEDKILNIGCGDSNLSEGMYRDGFMDIESCDYSSVVIEKKKEKCMDKIGLKWSVEDIHHMSYQNESFDVILDKGTLDAVICGDESACDPNKVMAEVNRVMKKNGTYICISYGFPEYRMEYFQNPSLSWKISSIAIPKTELSSQPNRFVYEVSHYMYICRKAD